LAERFWAVVARVLGSASWLGIYLWPPRALKGIVTVVKFNSRARTVGARRTAPVISYARPTGVTFEGAPGYGRTPQSELFLLAVTYFVGEGTFYEGGTARDLRFRNLIHTCAITHRGWTTRLLAWLRTVANLRSASVVGAAEFVNARLGLGCAHATGCVATSAARVVPGAEHEQFCDAHAPVGAVLPAVSNADVIDSVLQRADEPDEMVAYWTSRYGLMPMPVKKGVARAMARLWNEYSLLKYDTDTKAFRWGDVVELVHPRPPRWADKDLTDPQRADKLAWWDALMTHALDRRRSFDDPVPDRLRILTRRRELMGLRVPQRRAWLKDKIARGEATEALRRCGMTWEALAGWLQGPMDREAWEAIIPSLGVHALRANVRNFDQAGVSDAVVEEHVIPKFRDAAFVARSRQLPMRWLSAYRAAVNDRWKHPLGVACDHSLANIPELDGRTLVLIDTSGSMDSPLSEKGTLLRWDAAVLFGLGMARRCASADVVSFSYDNLVFDLRVGENLLQSVERWKRDGYFIGHSTHTARAIQDHYNGHDRVVIITDEQASYERVIVNESAPADVPIYTWNLAGYQFGHGPSGADNRYTFGGLTDGAFAMIPVLERQASAGWPF
jgi:hypothetical protein